jgi:acetyltransferase-like isoleucine patch superfamily enzyme
MKRIMISIVRHLILWQLYCIRFVFGGAFIKMQFQLFSQLVSAANVLRILGATVGPRTSIASSICVQNTKDGKCDNLQIGKNVTIADRCLLDLASNIIIEDDVSIAAQVSFVTHADVGNTPLRHIFPRREGPITVQKGAWLGVNTTVLYGVTIGRCAMIGAMSLVNKDVPPNSLSVGIPCKVIKRFDEPEETYRSNRTQPH